MSRIATITMTRDAPWFTRELSMELTMRLPLAPAAAAPLDTKAVLAAAQAFAARVSGVAA